MASGKTKLPAALCLSRDTGRLTLSQRRFYEDNGYLVIPRLIPAAILERCSRRFDEIVSGIVSPPANMVVMRDVKDRKSVNKLQDLAHDDVLKEYIENKELLDIVESFTGPNVMMMHSMLIAKPPDIGYGTSRHPPHQDLYYFPFRPADLVVASWTAIEVCDRENGCLYVLPGSHQPHVLHPHSYPAWHHGVNKMYYGIQDLPESTPWVDLEMQPGDTVFFHPLLIHGSGMNSSNRTRKAISSHYASAECFYTEVEGTIQATINDELMEVIRRKNVDTTQLKYSDIWRFKSKLVRGIRSSL